MKLIADIKLYPQEGLRIFGMLSSNHEAELRLCFDEVADLPAPEIDMSNFENTGTLLYPVFESFFQRMPGSRWRVNAAAHRHMKQADIPETSMDMETHKCLSE